MSTFSSWLQSARSKLKDVAPEVDAGFDVLEFADSLTGIGGPGALVAIKVLRTALDNLAQSGTDLTHDQLVQKLADLKAEASAQPTSIEGAQDAALDAKFPAPPVSTGGA